MSVTQHAIVELHCENVRGKVRVVLPDKHIMVLPMESAVQACGAFKDQYIFQQQFTQLLNHLADWITDHKEKISGAYLTTRDAGLLFLVVQKDVKYDETLDDALTDVDLEIANDNDYSLIRLHVQNLPQCSDESVNSFLATGRSSLSYKF